MVGCYHSWYNQKHAGELYAEISGDVSATCNHVFHLNIYSKSLEFASTTPEGGVNQLQLSFGLQNPIFRQF